jgi:hypothetical protein
MTRSIANRPGVRSASVSRVSVASYAPVMAGELAPPDREQVVLPAAGGPVPRPMAPAQQSLPRDRVACHGAAIEHGRADRACAPGAQSKLSAAAQRQPQQGPALSPVPRSPAAPAQRTWPHNRHQCASATSASHSHALRPLVGRSLTPWSPEKRSLTRKCRSAVTVARLLTWFDSENAPHGRNGHRFCVRIKSVTWVELWGFEPQTSCMP